MTPATRTQPGKWEGEVPLLDQSDDWVLQFERAHNEDGQRKSGPFPHIVTTGKRPDEMSSDKLKAVIEVVGTRLPVGRDAYRVTHQKEEQL